MGNRPDTSPLRRMVTRSQIRNTSSSRWLMKITEMPWSASRRITPKSTSTSLVSSDEVGSSMMTSFAWMVSARAMATIC